MTLNRVGRLFFNLVIFPPALFFWIVGDAFACSCMKTPAVCEAFGSADAVFVGRVIGGANREVDKDTGTVHIGGKIRFAVEESFSGPKLKTMTIHSGTGGGDCGYWFKLGEVYLVYAYGNLKEGFGTGICTRTKPQIYSTEDIDFLHSLPAKGTGVKIHGRVYSNVIYEEGKEPKYDGLPDIKITAKDSSGRTFRKVTDENGKYEFKGLKAGAYIVEADLPDYYQKGIYSTIEEVSVVDRGCAEVGFPAIFDGRLSGVVVDDEDRPVPKAYIVLLSADKDEILRLFHETGRDFADENGRFEITQIPPGRYQLGINVNRSPDEDVPYPPTWYPGVPDKNRATIIEIGLGEKLKDYTIKLPRKLIRRVIKGAIFWPNGRPAANADVYLEAENNPGYCVNGCSNDADALGNFTLIGYEGMKYRIQAKAPLNPDADYKDQKFLHAAPVLFEVKEDLSGLKIVLTLDQQTFEDRYKKKQEK